MADLTGIITNSGELTGTITNSGELSGVISNSGQLGGQVTGQKGLKGDKGDPGDKGDTGNGISSAVLNQDYTLTLNFTDGTSTTTTSIRGEKGDTGDKGETGDKGDPGEDGNKGDKGDTGESGFSPIASVSKTGNKTTVSVTDEIGTTTADVYDGNLEIITEVIDDSLYFYDAPKGSNAVYSKTTAQWNSTPTQVSESGTLYVYTDYKTIDGEDIAGIKVGDGLAYIVDLPFIEGQFDTHMADTAAHVSSADRTAWNNKVSASLSGEVLVLATS